MPNHKVITSNLSAFPVITSDYIIFLLFFLNLPCKELYIHYSHSIFTINLCSGVYYYSCFTDEETEIWKVKQFACGHATKL